MSDPAVAAPAVEAEPGFKVFAGNLLYSTTEDALKAFFAPVEKDILSTQIIFRGTRSAGYGFVSFNTLEAATNAVTLLNGKELEGRALLVQLAKPKDEKDQDRVEKRAAKKRQGRRGAKAATGEISEAEANGEAEKKEVDPAAPTDGTAKPKKKKNPRKPRAKKAANGDAAVDATATNGSGDTTATTPAPPKKVKTPRAPRPSRPAGEQPAGNPSKTVLFVANLGFTIDDAALSELFTEAGLKVVTARVVRRRWGQPRRSKGYGFVDVGSEEEQAKAIEILKGKEIGGREIAVKIAVDEQPRESKAGEDDGVPEAAVAA